MYSPLSLWLLILVAIPLNQAVDRRGNNIELSLIAPAVDSYRTPLRSASDGLYFRQKLDHFGDGYGYWKQRYWYDVSMYRVGGPVFVKIGGEFASSMAEISRRTTIGRWAALFGGVIVHIEHRYYGTSQPTDQLSNADMRRYLNVGQALADIANFVRTMRSNGFLPRAKWIAIGCSYAGTLAAWVRQEYPSVIDGAIASSAPVLATANFREYFRVIDDVLRRNDPKCYVKMIRLQNDLRIKLRTESGRSEFRNRLGRSVSAHSAELAISNLLYDFFGMSFQRLGYCRLDHSNMDVIDQLAPEITVRKKSFVPPKKFNSVVPAGSPFRFQLCSEFGFFPTTDSSVLFGKGKKLGEHLHYCNRTFHVTPNTENVNRRYGGNHHFRGTNVIFVNGLHDPWHSLSVLSSSSSMNTVVNIPDGLHCSDVFGINRSTKPSVARAIYAVEAQLEKWLIAGRSENELRRRRARKMSRRKARV